MCSEELHMKESSQKQFASGYRPNKIVELKIGI